MPREADLTLADFWQYKGVMNEKDIGVSLVAVNNQKGVELFKSAEGLLNIEPTTEEEALHSCRHMDEHPLENPNRQAFIEKAIKDGYYAAAKQFIHAVDNSLIKKVKSKLRVLLRR